MTNHEDVVPVDVCVIGGGWAGLAAAVEAVAAGRTVTLIDAAPQLGGRARALSMDMGFGTVHLDNGQHLLMGAYRETLALVSRVSPAGQDALQRARLHLTDSGGLSLRAPRLPAPLHLAVALALARGLGLWERIACARFMLELKRRNWEVERDETVSALLDRMRQPATLVRRLWHPLCVSALNTPPRIACARTFAAVLRDTLGADRASSDFLIPRATLGDCLPTPAADWLARHGAQIRLRTPARALCATDTGWQVRLSDGELPARSVVLAVPPSNAARLLRTLDSTGAPEALARQLDAFAPVPIATTYAAWPSGVAGALPPMMMIAHPESPTDRAESMTPLGDWVFDRGVQQGHRIVSVVASAVQLPPTDALDTITRSMATSAAHALGLPAPAHAATVIERRATFACVPDRPRIDPAPTGHLPALWIAGDFTEYDYPATIESAVRSGLRAGARAAGIEFRGSQAQAAVRA